MGGVGLDIRLPVEYIFSVYRNSSFVRKRVVEVMVTLCFCKDVQSGTPAN